MKKKLQKMGIVLGAILIIFNSCKKNTNLDQSVVNTDTKISILKSLGYRTDDIVKKNGYYIVEGDILIKNNASIFSQLTGVIKSSVQTTDTLKKAPSQAIVDNNYRVAQTVISVYVDPSIPSDNGTDDWHNAIANALYFWNSIPNNRISFSLTTSNTADITIRSDAGELTDNVIAAAMFPNSSSQPGSLVEINLDFLSDMNVSDGQKSYNVVHELGHTLGFRHSNWNTFNEPTYGNASLGGNSFYVAGANLINGTFNSGDNNSVMNAGTALSSYNGFSAFDILAVRTIYPADLSQRPIYRYINSKSYHFYTSDWNELGMGSSSSGFKYEQPSGYVYNNQVSGTVPFYRFIGGSDHYYSQNGTAPRGYTREGVIGYIYSSQVPGSIPLYQYYKSTAGHFYTTDAQELNPNSQGYAFEGITCYVIQ